MKHQIVVYALKYTNPAESALMQEELQQAQALYIASSELGGECWTEISAPLLSLPLSFNLLLFSLAQSNVWNIFDIYTYLHECSIASHMNAKAAYIMHISSFHPGF